MSTKQKTKPTKPSPAEALGKRITLARQKKGISLDTLGKAVGLSGSYLVHVCAGRRGLTPERAIAVAKALDADPSTFLRPDQAKLLKSLSAAMDS